jgi:hypothetical protein
MCSVRCALVASIALAALPACFSPVAPPVGSKDDAGSLPGAEDAGSKPGADAGVQPGADAGAVACAKDEDCPQPPSTPCAPVAASCDDGRCGARALPTVWQDDPGACEVEGHCLCQDLDGPDCEGDWRCAAGRCSFECSGRCESDLDCPTGEMLHTTAWGSRSCRAGCHDSIDCPGQGLLPARAACGEPVGACQTRRAAPPTRSARRARSATSRTRRHAALVPRRLPPVTASAPRARSAPSSCAPTAPTAPATASAAEGRLPVRRGVPAGHGLRHRVGALRAALPAGCRSDQDAGPTRAALPRLRAWGAAATTAPATTCRRVLLQLRVRRGQGLRVQDVMGCTGERRCVSGCLEDGDCGADETCQLPSAARAAPGTASPRSPSATATRSAGPGRSARAAAPRVPGRA